MLKNGSSYNSEQYISFQSNEGTDGWYKKLDDSARQQRSRVYRACGVRTAFYQSEWGLSDKDSRHLTVAGKGIADKVIADWKKTTRRQLKTYEEQAGRFGGNFSFSMQVVDLKQIEQNAMWLHTVKKVSGAEPADGHDRSAALRVNQATFLTALLDRELWLTRGQRIEVQKLISKCLPTGAWTNPYRNSMEEVALLVIPLFKFSKQDSSTFQGPQKVAWDTLRKEFEFNGRYVVVHAKNGGQFHFQIPK